METKSGSDVGGKQKSDSTLDSAIAKVPTPESGAEKGKFPSSSITGAKSKKPKRGHRRLGRVVLSGIILVIVAAAVCLYLAGYIYIGFKSPNQTIILSTNICSDEDINSYNKAISDFRFDDSESMNGLRDLANNVKAKEKYDKDPTCLYIVYMNATAVQDAKTAKSAGQRLIDLNKEGLFVNNRISTVIGVDTISTFIEQLNTVPSEQPNPDEAEQ
ncbi:hypothetical protein FWG95_02615 [Candidatus Saccharibacteria bacterium]|nr:hypothetical protein [Candidatus Saccharibacteria bacterium]